MRLREFIPVRDEGDFALTPEWAETDAEIREAIRAVGWPPGSPRFVVPPVPKGNGVGPIKDAFVTYLSEKGWRTEQRARLLDKDGPGKIDALKDYLSEKSFVCEWETGNTSSSHRAMNKMVVALKEDNISGGALVVPDRALARYLTDRIGNYEELIPYLEMWREAPLPGGGLLAIYVVTADDFDPQVPRIHKGTDGRALI